GYEQFKISLKLNDNLNLVVQENLLNIRVVKSFVMETHETRKFNNKANKLRKIQLFVERIIALSQPLIQLIINVCVVPIIYYGSRFVFSGEMEIGKVSSFITYTFTIVMQLAFMCFMMVKIVMSLASIDRVKEVLDDIPEIKDGSKNISLISDGSIVYKNVNFSYVNDINKLVLKNINLEIKSGETVGIIGGTASGKTTLVQLLLRLYDVFSGEVIIGGTNVKDYNLKSLIDKIAIVPQKNILFSGTVRDNMKWGNDCATDDDIISALKQSQAYEFVDNLPNRLDYIVERDGVNFSGGQKQRLCIARALLKDAKILILDDSTSAVDTTTDYRIRKVFREELPNITKIIISQRILSVEDSDKIIVMENGEINAIGTHDDLLKSNEIYKDIYSSQMDR
ncbi:MAG: ABC transporter ATP-binding protein/permease, partial [Rickettsiales bacterium]|nr:ABC transporter ATP-binding protein/permease [Rickettsiales bacterium]